MEVHKHVDDEGTFTWNEFTDRAMRAAGALAGLGVPEPRAVVDTLGGC